MQTRHLLDEFLKARRIAFEPRLQGAIAALGLPHDASAWGLDFVEFADSRYRPRLGGDSALIVPVLDGDVLADLVACRVTDRRTATRLGKGRALGEGNIRQAALDQASLMLFSDPLAWLLAGCEGAVVLDWRHARTLLRGVGRIGCDCPLLTHRVEALRLGEVGGAVAPSPSGCLRSLPQRSVPEPP